MERALAGAGVRAESTGPLGVVQNEGTQPRPGDAVQKDAGAAEGCLGVSDGEEEEGAAKRTPGVGRERDANGGVFAGKRSWGRRVLSGATENSVGPLKHHGGHVRGHWMHGSGVPGSTQG